MESILWHIRCTTNNERTLKNVGKKTKTEHILYIRKILRLTFQRNVPYFSLVNDCLPSNSFEYYYNVKLDGALYEITVSANNEVNTFLRAQNVHLEDISNDIFTTS